MLGGKIVLLEIEVVEVRGICPVHRVGDKIVIDGASIMLDKTDALCIHAMSVILHYAVALDEGADPVKLGLTKPEDRDHAYLQCVDPWKPYTEGGTVIFRVKRVK
ncbi:MAG: TIGR04076 family protein [Candidatus Bathyarchaeia archaeon]